MIGRLFWFGLGIVCGSWAVLRLKRLLLAWTPSGVADRATGLGRRARNFAGDVRTAANAKEAELRDALDLSETTDDDKDAH